MVANNAVMQMLAQISVARETGTLFITTTENRACHIVFEKGRIIALSYGAYRGEQVVCLLYDMPVERFSFKAGTKMPLAGRSFVDEAYDAIAELELSANDAHAEPELPSPKRIYRGQVVLEPVEQPVSAQKNKKPVRMYRGQPLQDD